MHGARPQTDDIGREAQQHLRRGLAADAAIDDALAEQRRVGGLPHFGDRIADEHQFLRDALERAVRVAIAAELRPVRFGRARGDALERIDHRSEEHTSELQSLMRISYAVFCLKKKKKHKRQPTKLSLSRKEQLN